METNHHSPGRPLPPIAISELHRRVLMSFIESQTTDTWHPVGGVRASAARDLMTYDIPAHELTDAELEVIIQRTEEADRFQDLWRHEGATGITRVFGIRIAGLDKAISGIGYAHQRQEEDKETSRASSTVEPEVETSSAAGDKAVGRGGGSRAAGRGRGGGGHRKKPSTASATGAQPRGEGPPPSRGRRGHARMKSNAQ